MARLAIEEHAERLLSNLEEKQTTIILFDTDKPVNDSTGLPPVKTIVSQETKREEVERLDTRKEVQSETELKEETTDKSVEEKGSWRVKFHECLGWILTIPVMIILIYGLYKLIKFFK